MEPRIEILPGKKLVGKRMKMSLVNNKTVELWRSFMPKRNEIRNKVTADFFSMQVYDPSFDFKNFNPAALFEKWAAVEVSGYSDVPEDMETFDLPGGLYAVFIHRGPASMGHITFQFIFGLWLPNSKYEIDNRPHFELLGSRYKNDDPDSEEEVWIPVKQKK